MTTPSITYHPSLAPLPETPMDAIQRAHKAGALSDQEMLACQDALYPPCVDHALRPGKFVIGGYPRCAECAEQFIRARRA